MGNILIIQAARFGDLLQSKRLILTLAEKNAVHLAVDSALAPLATLIYPYATVHRINFHGSLDDEKLTHNRRMLAAFIDLDFDRVYNCNFSPLTDAICRLFESERVVGYRPAHDSEGGLERSAWARLAFRLSSMRRVTSLNLVDYWGLFGENPVSPEKVNPPAMPGGKGIGVAVAGREERRSLPLDALAAACHTASRFYRNPPIYLFGTEGEASRARKLMRLFDAPMLKATVNLCGQTSWAELIERLVGLDLLLTPDTGLMHLAAHLGVPTLCFFLSSAWCQETGPYGLGHRIFQAAPMCAPCLEAAPCTQHLRCHHLFQRTDFTRCVGEALDRILPLPWPDGLQLWQSDFDALGARPLLLRGHDNTEDMRKEARNIVKSHVGLVPLKPDGKFSSLLQKLDPPAEWMLPPNRYC